MILKPKIFLRILLNFFTLFNDLLKSLIFFIKIDKKIFIQLEGGFGHTLSEPHYLNLTEKDNWVLIFAYSEKFHSKEINKIFNKNIFFINKTSLFYTKKNIVEKIFIFTFKNFIKKKLINLNEFILAKQNKVYKNNYHKTLESVTFKKFRESASHDIYTDIIKNLDYSNILKNFEGDFKGRIYFNYRKKAKHTDSSDLESKFRDSNDIYFYKPLFDFLIDNNWQIFCGINFQNIPDWVNDYDNSFIHPLKAKFTVDEFQFFAGVITDLYIGGTSGGAMYNLINSKKKSLILNALPFGYSYINCISSYPILHSKDLLEFKQLLECSFFNNDKYDENLLKKIRPLNIQEQIQIVEEFINNYKREDYGISLNDLGIENQIMNDTNGKVSPKWLELIEYKKLK